MVCLSFAVTGRGMRICALLFVRCGVMLVCQSSQIVSCVFHVLRVVFLACIC